MISPSDSHLSDTRARLIEAASQAFLDSGYSASMESIAVRAGVAKQTLYNHFARKDTLFAEVIRRDAESMATALGDAGGELRTRLIGFGMAFRLLVLSTRCISLYRMLIAESVRFPEMTRTFYESGPAHTLRELAGLIESEMRAGRLNGNGPEAAKFAAEMLLDMLSGTQRTRHLLGLESHFPINDDLRTQQIVDCFLRAFSPQVENC